MSKNVLLIFCDMVRGNLLSDLNKNIKESEFEIFLKSLKGTLYTNAYTPAPDTGRGYAMLQTGLSCKKNGCDDVWKTPKFFLKENIATLDKIMSKNEINTKYLIPERDDMVGVLGKEIKSKILVDFNNITYKDGFKSLRKDIETFKNNFFWVSFDDYHVAADDYGASMKSDEVGKEKLAIIFKLFFSILPKEKFDEIIIVSDHGNVHKYGFKDERVLNLLNDDRTKILLYRWKKGNNKFLLNNELRSILDIYPTILERFSIKYKELDGISLNINSHKDRKIVMESYSKFFHLAPLDLWGVRTNKYLYLTNLKFKSMYKVNGMEYEKCKVDVEMEKEFIKELKKESVCYEIKKLEKESIVRYYRMLNCRYKYSDNSPRKIYNLSRIKSIKINRIPYYCSVILNKFFKK